MKRLNYGISCFIENDNFNKVSVQSKQEYWWMNLENIHDHWGYTDWGVNYVTWMVCFEEEKLA